MISCSDEEELKLEVYNPEIFAFDIGSENEVNSTIRVRGFKQSEEGQEFTASVAYELDLVRPDGNTEKSFISKVEDLKFRERVKDSEIDIQFTLDSTYVPGKYQIIFNIKDTYTNNTAVISSEFELTE
jgi:hypothetical protein